MKELQGRDIICISTVDWEPLWTRKQQIMSRLPKDNRILYVEPPQSYIAHFKDPSLKELTPVCGAPPRQIRENLWLYKPRKVLPFASRYPLLNPINQKGLAREIRARASQLGFRDDILWTYNHTSCDLVSALPHQLLVYDCVDEHAAYAGFNYSLVKAMERRLVEQADVTFCTARSLYEERKPWAKQIWLSPNAADVSHFGQANQPDAPVAAEMQGLPQPRFGFIGAVKEWIDLSLLEAVAQAFPQGSVAVIGPVGAGIDTAALKALPNVHFLGRKDKADLPLYLAGIDVCLNPFKQDELTASVSPLKFYEYLASGRPIASVPMPELESFAGLVEFGSKPEGFVQAAIRALADTAEKQQQRLAASLDNSWESRTGFMMEKIAACLEQGNV